MATTASFWCYRCNRFISVRGENNAACPNCGSGFIEAMEPTTAPSSPVSRRNSPVNDRPERRTSIGFRRCRRNTNRAERTPFNPVVIMRSPRRGDGGDGEGQERSYQLYYYDGDSSDLRPLPPGMSELLLGSGFDRLLDQLGQLETNRSENPPASKSAIESMPEIEIEACHVSADLSCAICKEAFEIGSTAREMPCKHLYHTDCILPWLEIRNSCPICRHELPGEPSEGQKSGNSLLTESEPVGLTIWRLRGGGYAVSRFTGTRGPGDRAFPVVDTEMDADSSPRSIGWGSNRRGRRNNGMGRFFGNLGSFFRRFMTSSSMSLISSEPVSSSDLIMRRRSLSG